MKQALALSRLLDKLLPLRRFVSARASAWPAFGTLRRPARPRWLPRRWRPLPGRVALAGLQRRLRRWRNALPRMRQRRRDARRFDAALRAALGRGRDRARGLGVRLAGLPGRIHQGVERRYLAPLRAGLDRRIARIVAGAAITRRQAARLRRWPPRLRREDCRVCAALRARLVGLLRLLRERLRRRSAAVDPSDQRLVFRALDYPGSRNRYYHLHLPPRIDDGRPRPLVLLLHGCRQTDAQIRQISNLDALADQHGFIAVYPWVTAYSGLRTRNCWGWWYSNEIRAGAGEVEDLWQIVEEVCATHPVDRRRIHVAGLSSGGGMTVAMMMAHARRIASGAVVAGVPYGEGAGAVSLTRRSRGVFKPVETISAAMNEAMGDRRRLVPVMIVHSHDDETVNIRAAENIRDSWAQAFHIGLHRRSSRSGVTHGTPWEHCRYRDADRRSVIETLFLHDKGHGWYGGRPGPYSYPDAPNLSRLMWEFFHAHPLA